MRSDIQSVEVSFLLQATEDEGRTTRAVKELLGALGEPERQELEGHYSNTIVWVKFRPTGQAAQDAFLRLLSRLGKEGRDALRRDLGSFIDEHGSLFLRMSKQLAVQGSAVLSGSDPIRVKVKPRGYLIRGKPLEFYGRLMEAS